jgi:hypothetical protein
VRRLDRGEDRRHREVSCDEINRLATITNGQKPVSDHLATAEPMKMNPRRRRRSKVSAPTAVAKTVKMKALIKCESMSTAHYAILEFRRDGISAGGVLMKPLFSR